MIIKEVRLFTKKLLVISTLTQLHSERPKLYTSFAFLSAIRLNSKKKNVRVCQILFLEFQGGTGHTSLPNLEYHQIL